jgi:mannose-1-phosphate guanylyltransferase/mannose-1-phosphate guanylyltransferase/phosphomannomutase
MLAGVLVLAAGKSTRISSLSGGLPKPLLEFGGKPLIGWALDWLAAAGVSEVCINLHYRPESIRSALGDGSRYGLRIRYVHESEILGTAGAWRNAAGDWNGTSLVVYGDNVLRFDLAAFLAAHRRSGALGTVALFDPTRHRNTGIAGGHVVLGEGGLIEEFREGVPPRVGRREYVNAGAYLLEPALLHRIPPGFQDFGRDLFPTLLAGGHLHGHLLEDTGFCLGLDTPESYAEAQRLLGAEEVRLS